MVWRKDDPEGNEAEKIRWEIVPYTRGKVLDLGCGPHKAFPHFIGVDNGDHEKFGYSIRPDMRVDTCEDLWFAKSQAYDAVFSSHLLEHIEDYKAALKEWWRVIKPGGYLVLYIPHKDFYPNMGKPGSNPDHKHDFSPEDIVTAMRDVKGWELVEKQDRNEDREYSFFQVYKKLKSDRCIESWNKAKPEKSAAVIRYGAFGDLMQASSIFAGLKQQGYHVTLYSSPPGSDVVTHDPNIDRIILQDKDQVPNGNLGDFWNYIEKKYDKFINLSESVEGTWLALPDRIHASWTRDLRHKYLNKNYLEFQHELSGVPHKPQIKFYPTAEEMDWAKRERQRMGRFVVMWSLAGSSIHKSWPYVDNVIASILIQYGHIDPTIVLVGGAESVILEAGWQNEKRVVKTCGKWGIRQSLTFLYHCDMVVGPETGLLNAAACMDLQKIVFLSHSSNENLTRDWKNTVALAPKNTSCYPCHLMHYNWTHCHKDEDKDCKDCDENEKQFKARCCLKHKGGALCQSNISAQDCWDAMSPILDRFYEKAA